jgi:hypothetical protein
MGNKKQIYLGFEALIVVIMKNFDFWHITSGSPLKFNRRFAGKRYLQMISVEQGTKVSLKSFFLHIPGNTVYYIASCM